MFGYSSDELLGRNAAILFHDPVGLSRFAEMLKSQQQPGSKKYFAEPGQPATEENQWICVRKDGTRIPVLLTLTVLRNEQGRFNGTVCIAREITESLENDRIFRTAFEHAPIGIALVDTDGRWLQVNRSICDMLGYSEAEFRDLTFQDLTFPEDLSGDLHLVRETINGIRRGFQMEKRYVHKDGRIIWGRLSATLVRNADHTPRYFISHIEDITQLREDRVQLKEAKEAADAASRAKGDFLAMMSHEIRTPLNSIIGFAKLLRDTSLAQDQSSFLAAIETGSEALLIVINDILDYSKIEANRIDLENIAFSLPQCLQSALDMVTPQAEQKHLPIRASIDPNVPRNILGDVTRLRQVLVNLLSNAVKFTQRGEITLRVESASFVECPKALTFVIHDTGIGIPEKKISELFVPFHQLDISTTRRFGGTGLGLAISRRLVELMGGSIELESHEGDGTTARFHLPLRPVEEIDANHRLEAPKPPKAPILDISRLRLIPEAAPLRILVAEDNGANQRLIIQLLKKIGATEIHVTSNGAEALERLRSEPFDVVLMDCQMPVMDGYESSRQIRLFEQGDTSRRRVEIIALTAAALEGDRKKALEAGMDDYLTKPLHLESLIQRLNAAALRRFNRPA
jgi:PAS domain S-box-containing protein